MPAIMTNDEECIIEEIKAGTPPSFLSGPPFPLLFDVPPSSSGAFSSPSEFPDPPVFPSAPDEGAWCGVGVTVGFSEICEDGFGDGLGEVDLELAVSGGPELAAALDGVIFGGMGRLDFAGEEAEIEGRGVCRGDDEEIGWSC